MHRKKPNDPLFLIVFGLLFAFSLVYLIIFPDSNEPQSTYPRFSDNFQDPDQLMEYTYTGPSFPNIPEVHFIPAETVPRTSSQDKSPSYSSVSTLTLITPPGTVERGHNAYIKVKGKPNTVYSITVYYPSGESEAQGLNKKESNASGYVSWSWKVGSNTTPGTHRIVIRGGGERIIVKFQVTR